MPAPNQIIINGPNDTFGRELIIFKNGSNIFAIVLFNHKSDAINIPKIDAIKKLISVSYNVISIWANNSDLLNCIIVLTIFFGEEKRNVFIRLLSARNCQRKNINIKINYVHYYTLISNSFHISL